MHFEELELAQYRIPDTEEVQTITDVRLLTEQTVERLVMKKVRPKALNLTCGRSECDKELHTFRPLTVDLSATGVVPCTSCGFELVGSDPLTLRNLSVDQLFTTLQREWIRHFFFHLPLTDRVRKFAYRNGRDGLIDVAGHQLRSGRMIGYSPRWDSQQTAMLRGTIVHWARHAVACCCRRCIAYWHGVPMSHVLTETDISYFQMLIGRYVDLRLPELQVTPVKKTVKSARVPLQRKAG